MGALCSQIALFFLKIKHIAPTENMKKFQWRPLGKKSKIIHRTSFFFRQNQLPQEAQVALVRENSEKKSHSAEKSSEWVPFGISSTSRSENLLRDSNPVAPVKSSTGQEVIVKLQVIKSYKTLQNS